MGPADFRRYPCCRYRPGTAGSRACLLRAAVAFLLTAISAFAADADARFSVASYPFTIVRQTPQGEASISTTAMFKVDTTIGSVWRMESNAFRRIVVRELFSQDDYAKQLELRARYLIEQRLRGIAIPEINFRQTSISNMFSTLERLIRENDHAKPTGTNDFVRFRLVGFSCTQSGLTNDPFATIVGDATDAGCVTFQVSYVTAYDALKILSEVCNVRYRFEGNCIVIMPSYGEEEGCMETQRYTVAPAVQGHLTDAALTNALARFGMPKLYVGGSVSYSPEFGQITVVELPHRIQPIETILCMLGVVDFVGRYRFISGADHGQPLLLLQDHKNGESWRYQFVVKSDGTVNESFVQVPTHE